VDATEGFVPFRGYRTWYRAVGAEEEGKLPILLLHGGPGATHDYLEPLEALGATGRRAVFYDQLGCGKSDLPGEESLWVVETFVDEVGAVRRELGLDRIHLFGSSWGGMLAMQYALTQPLGLESLIIASSPASMSQWVEETGRLRAQLPPEVQEVLDRHEAAGTTDDPEYEEAAMVFYKQHVCRADPWPESVLRSFQFIAEHGVVYHTMNGPSEFHVTGNLREWSVVDRLGEIRVPTLVVTGEHDEATPAINRVVAEGISGAESVIYPGASHMAHVEDTEGYVRLLDGFMSRVESRITAAAVTAAGP
jgi:L-proline amide hydrolase